MQADNIIMSKNKERALNMQERRKLETIMFQDIDKAVREYRNKCDKAENALVAKYRNSAKVKNAVKKVNDARKAREKAENELKALGFSINSWNNDTSFGNSDKVPTIKKAREVQQRNIQRMEEMKRQYTIKLFAGGAEAVALFEELQAEIKRIVG